MALASEQKQEIIDKYQKAKGDTGSTDVQIALLTARINDISAHLQQHKHDFHGTRGLLRLVGKRRRLLDYLRRKDIERYRSLIKELGIRK